MRIKYLQKYFSARTGEGGYRVNRSVQSKVDANTEFKHIKLILGSY